MEGTSKTSPWRVVGRIEVPPNHREPGLPADATLARVFESEYNAKTFRDRMKARYPCVEWKLQRRAEVWRDQVEGGEAVEVRR